MKDYSFGNYICALRTGLGLSQFQLGALVGVTDKAVSKWENGDAKPRVSTCYRLADILGVSISELLSCKQITVPARKELEKMSNKLWKEAYERLSIYGNTPPAECLSRLAAEETALRGTDAIHGFAVVGKMQEALQHQKKTMLVAGSINSSFTAWLFGATMVNPLHPHYRCPKCGSVVFSSDAENGFDLPARYCTCGEAYIRDGHNLPFDGYAKAERAGTHIEFRISEEALPIAVKTLLEFYDGKADILPVKMISSYNNETVDRYIILPEHKVKPALSEDGFWHVSMDDYWEWQDNETSFTFMISNQLNVLDEAVENMSLALPNPISLMTPGMAEMLFLHRCEKFGFFTDCLSSSEAHDYDLLLRIDALSHSTGAWTENGDQLVADGVASVREIPASREHIWHTVSKALISHNVHDNGLALMAMENSRRGLFYSQGVPNNLRTTLLSLGLPEWYPDYLTKVRYLFPMGHCVAYLLIDALIEWVAENTQADLTEAISNLK